MSAPQAERFHWFGPETCTKLAAQLSAGPVARLEVHGEGAYMTLHVVHEGETAAAQPLNESFPCPPICP